METDAPALIVFTDHRRFGLMTLIETAEDRRRPAVQGVGPEPLSDDFDAAFLPRALKGKEDADQIGPARPAGDRGARQHLCLRGAVARAAFRPSARPPRCKKNSIAPARSRHQGRAQGGHQGRRFDACATTSAPMANSAISSTISPSMTAKASPARQRLQRHDQAHRAERAARLSTARAARDNVRKVALPRYAETVIAPAIFLRAPWISSSVFQFRADFQARQGSSASRPIPPR